MVTVSNHSSLRCSFQIINLGETQQKENISKNADKRQIVQTVDNEWGEKIRFLLWPRAKNELCPMGLLKRCKRAEHIKASGEPGELVARLVTKSAKHVQDKSFEEYRSWMIQSARQYIERSNRALEKLNDVDGVIRQYACIETIHKDKTPKYVVFHTWCNRGELLDLMLKKELNPEEKKRITSKLLQTLTKMHELGVYHRDLKPDNILIDENGNPIITDFDMAYTTKEGLPDQEELGLINGTMVYFAPEHVGRIFALSGNVGLMNTTEEDLARNDVWAMGLILYCLYYDDFPESMSDVFEWEEIDLRMSLVLLSNKKERIVPKSGDPVKELISKMLCTDPKTRITAKNAFQEFQLIPPHLLKGAGEG
jgi:serine/threonine protein kinase